MVISIDASWMGVGGGVSLSRDAEAARAEAASISSRAAAFVVSALG